MSTTAPRNARTSVSSRRAAIEKVHQANPLHNPICQLSQPRATRRGKAKFVAPIAPETTHPRPRAVRRGCFLAVGLRSCRSSPCSSRISQHSLPSEARTYFTRLMTGSVRRAGRASLENTAQSVLQSVPQSSPFGCRVCQHGCTRRPSAKQRVYSPPGRCVGGQIFSHPPRSGLA